MFKDISLNSQQYAAAAFTGGNLLLAAGPGSGKTHTMTARILFLIEERKIDPSSILVITFTKDAALSMQRRFGKMSDMFYPVA
ncbi:MAG: UvrD-helicase domain-containing protein, partial [Lachnospiraceae bacterium]|nr:UvrD-helicase domain-containing protein [Lachnospiraceae bacterium]